MIITWVIQEEVKNYFSVDLISISVKYSISFDFNFFLKLKNV